MSAKTARKVPCDSNGRASWIRIGRATRRKAQRAVEEAIQRADWASTDDPGRPDGHHPAAAEAARHLPRPRHGPATAAGRHEQLPRPRADLSMDEAKLLIDNLDRRIAA